MSKRKCTDGICTRCQSTSQYHRRHRQSFLWAQQHPSYYLVLDSRDLADTAIVDTLNQIEKLGQDQYEDYVSERLVYKTKTITVSIKRHNLPLFSLPPVWEKTRPSNSALIPEERLFPLLQAVHRITDTWWRSGWFLCARKAGVSTITVATRQAENWQQVWLDGLLGGPGSCSKGCTQPSNTGQHPWWRCYCEHPVTWSCKNIFRLCEIRVLPLHHVSATACKQSGCCVGWVFPGTSEGLSTKKREGSSQICRAIQCNSVKLAAVSPHRCEQGRAVFLTGDKCDSHWHWLGETNP